MKETDWALLRDVTRHRDELMRERDSARGEALRYRRALTRLLDMNAVVCRDDCPQCSPREEGDPLVTAPCPACFAREQLLPRNGTR